MRKIDLTKGSIVKGLLSFALPVFLIYLFNSLYNAVDIFILSLANAEEHMGMVASAYTPINLAISLLMGAGVASTFLVAQYYGGKDEINKKKAIKTIFIFNIVASLILAAIILCFSPFIIKWLHIDDTLYFYALRYLLIQTIILPFNAIVLSTQATYKGQGQSVLPFIYSGLGVIFNIIYDFVFIYVLNLKSDGAAVASVLSYCCAAICIFSYLFFIKYKCKNPLKGVKSEKKMYKHLAKQVIPLSLQEALVIICFTVLMSVINIRGTDASNVIAISDRITAISYAPVMAFGNAISAAVAQNLGAGDIKRTRKMVLTTFTILAFFTAIFSLPFYLFSKELAGLYTNNEEVINQVMERSWVIFFDLALCIFITPLNGLASGSGNSNWSLLVFLSSDVIVRIPLILGLGLTNYPIWIVSISYPASSVMALIICLVFYFLKKWQNLKVLPINQDKINLNEIKK